MKKNRKTDTEIYAEVSLACGRLVTRRYSTSFSLGTGMLSTKYRDAVYALYGFVRLADEIVDTFFELDQKSVLDTFVRDTKSALELGFSTNPILHGFALVSKRYGLEYELADAFFESMAMDLTMYEHDRQSYDRYVYGSAEVVGLMCLRIFCEGDDALYQRLLPSARSLGAAFQKVNFLRDLRDDFESRGRMYFPNLEYETFSAKQKEEIEREIELDFNNAVEGLLALPDEARKGVSLAYVYYRHLFDALKKASVDDLKSRRIRVPNSTKLWLWIKVQTGMENISASDVRINEQQYA